MKFNDNHYLVEVKDPKLLKVIEGWKKAKVIGQVKGMSLNVEFNQEHEPNR